MEELEGKRLLIMDRTALGACAVKRAKELGIYTVVANFYKTEDSPSKQIADEAIMVDISNIDTMVNLIKEKEIDGIFSGWTDSHLPFYAEICEKTGLPCSATCEQVGILSNNKRKFKNYCQKYGVLVPKEYPMSMEFKKEDLENVKYPVMVKPEDESGGRGVSKCFNEKELKENYTWLFNHSKSKKIFVEEYIDSSYEIFIHYTIQDGYCSLSDSFLKYRVMYNGKKMVSPILHVFGDKLLDEYKQSAEPAVLNMIKGLGIENGVMGLQGFYSKGLFYFYEPTIRLGGSQSYVFTEILNGVSSLDLLIEFAVTGEMGSINIKEYDNPSFSKACVNYYIILKPGKINKLEGIEQVKLMPQVLQVTTFKKVGDVIESTSSVDKVIYRLHVMDDTPEMLANTLVKISRILRIEDENGNNMQMEPLTFERAISMLK